MLRKISLPIHIFISLKYVYNPTTNSCHLPIHSLLLFCQRLATITLSVYHRKIKDNRQLTTAESKPQTEGYERRSLIDSDEVP